MCSSSAASTKFQLYGVVNHHGNVGGGHYTAHAAAQLHERSIGDVIFGPL